MSNAPFTLWPEMRRVEHAAWNAIRRCARADGVKTLPLPVPVERWIEGPLGIRFSIANLDHLGRNVLGVARARDREILISENAIHNEARFRFTAAHELGHVVLHAKLGVEFRDSVDGDFMERRIEREANRFAAAFLMPIPALCVEYPAVAGMVWDNPRSLLAAVRHGHSQATSVFRSSVLPRLANKFGVSLSATVRRFAEVLLANGEPAIPFQIGVRLLQIEQVKDTGDTNQPRL